MDEKPSLAIGRRDLLRVAGAASLAAAAIAAAANRADTTRADRAGKRKSQYREDAPEVQAFYRVNRYPVK